MAVRKTESRIPDGLTPADLGEAMVSADGRCALVSMISNPLVVGRENTWILFVTDDSLATEAESYEWSMAEEGAAAPVVQTSEHGEWSFRPTTAGHATLT